MPVHTRAASRRTPQYQPECFPDSSIGQLPTELVEEVLRFLPAADIIAAAVSCKYVYNAAFCERVWAEAFRNAFPELVGIIEACPPRWWRKSTWHRRYYRIVTGAAFSGQVFNREAENTSEDFLLSAYDAKLKLQKPFDVKKPVFVAKYLPMGKARVIERNIALERLRRSPIGVTPHAVYPTQAHVWQPGTDIEVQWKAQHSHPYGWWLGKVQEVHQDRLVLQFPQYTEDSQWRRVIVPLPHSLSMPSNWHPAYGYIGGARPVQPAEKLLWEQHRGQSVVHTDERPAAISAHMEESADPS